MHLTCITIGMISETVSLGVEAVSSRYTYFTCSSVKDIAELSSYVQAGL